MTICIEYLSLWAWMSRVLPCLSNFKKAKARVFYIDATKAGLRVARLTAMVLGITVERLDFRLVELRDLDGNILHMKMQYFDFSQVQNAIAQHPLFKEAVATTGTDTCFDVFLRKRIASFDVWTQATVWRALLLVRLAAFKLPVEAKAKTVVLFLRRRPWGKYIEQYAKDHGIEVRFAGDVHFHLKLLVLRLLGKRLRVVKSAFWCWRTKGFFALLKQTVKAIGLKDTANDGPGYLSVEYYGHLNLDHPELNSDLFFWSPHVCPGQEVLMVYHLPKDPLNDLKWKQMQERGMRAVALDPRASKVPSVPVFYHWRRLRKDKPVPVDAGPGVPGLERGWIKRQRLSYEADYEYWRDFFHTHRVNTYVTWYTLDASHCVIADALQSLGGITAVYQRSFQEFPSPETAIGADIAFSFSKRKVLLEENSGSRIPYHVVTGYLGDFRFPLLKPQAHAIRQKLHDAGAKRIICYFDESSLDDPRWHTGHGFMRANYAFLLEKFLADPHLGLVLKPKIPATLAKRLGPIAPLLARAQHTGRLFMFEGGSFHGAYPPAAGALVADIAIHGHLCAGTAGTESALAGVPTLLLDREGWSVSSLYNLGVGKVVFNNWEHLWATVQEYFNSPGNPRGIGDWTPMLDELDPFRDGKAAQRMGSYLKWVKEGFKQGHSRPRILANAAKRYADIWGADKIQSINAHDH